LGKIIVDDFANLKEVRLMMSMPFYCVYENL